MIGVRKPTRKVTSTPVLSSRSGEVPGAVPRSRSVSPVGGRYVGDG